MNFPYSIKDFTIVPSKLHHKLDFCWFNLSRIHVALIEALFRLLSYLLCFKLDLTHTYCKKLATEFILVQ